nr:MmgE/PrpD family protein [Pseudofrankia asymbiotica]
MRDFTADLAARVTALKAADVPAPIQERAAQSVLDWIGVTVAGAAEPAASIARSAGDGGAGPATVLGVHAGAGVQHAALVNGVAAHALDFDDGSGWMLGHPSVAVCPAALAVAEEAGASGEALLVAVVVGTEVAARVGLAMGESHYRRGWHGTGTTGTLAAAGAAGGLLGLDQTGMRVALGLAATQAAGLKAMFGTMAKPLHAGRAAMSGVLAAKLAAGGFTAPLDAIEAEQGLAIESDDFRPEIVEERLGGAWGIENTRFKLHACCGVTHPAIDALRALTTDGLAAGDVEHLVIEGGPLVWRTCQVDRPRSGLEAKFSLRYTAALALCGRPTTPEGFTDEAVGDTEVARLQDRVELREVERPGFGVTLRLRLRDGATLAQEADSAGAVADAGLPAQRTDLTRKFIDLVAPVLGSAGSAALLESVTALPTARTVADVAAGTLPAV